MSKVKDETSSYSKRAQLWRSPGQSGRATRRKRFRLFLGGLIGGWSMTGMSGAAIAQPAVQAASGLAQVGTVIGLSSAGTIVTAVVEARAAGTDFEGAFGAGAIVGAIASATVQAGLAIQEAGGPRKALKAALKVPDYTDQEMLMQYQAQFDAGPIHNPLPFGMPRPIGLTPAPSGLGGVWNALVDWIIP